MNAHTDATHMSRALDLAEATIGLASPNPQVGCVLVREGQIIAEGAHLYDLRDHAEIVALKQAATLGHSTQGTTAYVTLEPCSHRGRTGPCADALIAAGTSRCVVATVDPNPQVAGRGIARMRAAGIEVEIGLLQARARTLNNAFAFFITHGRPFVTLKAGLSVDGRLAPLPVARIPGQPFWLTGPESRAEVQRLRHASDALLTGIGTVLADDPLLTERSGLRRRRPLQRIVLDSRLQIPLDSNLVQQANDDLWVFTTPQAPESHAKALESRSIRVITLSQLSLEAILNHLHEAKLISVLAEAGPTLNAALLRDQLVEQAILFYAPTELGIQSLPFATAGPTSFELEARMLAVTKRTTGPDVCVSGLLHDPWACATQLV